MPTPPAQSKDRCTSVLQRLWPLLGVGLLALGVRGVYLAEIRSIPFFDMLVGDAASYHGWATRIAEEDWLGKETFYQAPAYPYFLGTIYSITGISPGWARAVQAVLGSLSCVLVALAGQTLVGRRAGLAAGVLMALYAPAIFFDGLIQKASLGLVLFAAILWRLAAARGMRAEEGVEQLSRSGGDAEGRRSSLRPLPHGRGSVPKAWNWLVCGVLLGLLGLTRENAMALAPIVLAWLWLGFREHPPAKRAAWSAALVSGLALALGPVVIRNYHVGGEFVLTTVQAGPNFYIGNNPRANGRYTPLVAGHESPPFEREDAKRLAQQAAGRELSDREVSQYWLSQAWDYIRNQPGDWLKLMGVKTALTFNAYELPDVEGYNLYRVYSTLLLVLGAIFHFGVLGPLAAAGVVLTWRDRSRHGILLILGAVMAATVIVFYVFARYRFPITPILAIYAGAGVVQGFELFRQNKRRALLKPAIAAALVAAACNVPVAPEEQLDAMAFANLGAALAQNGRYEEAIPAFEIALETNPGSAVVCYNLGLASRKLDRLTDAVEYFNRAKQFDPDLIEVDFQLGITYERLGDTRAALQSYYNALRVNPNGSHARAAIERLEGR